MKISIARTASLTAAIFTASCSSGGDSNLRKALDQLKAGVPAKNPLIVTDTVLRFIPLGTPEKQAADLLASAGLRQDGRSAQSYSDRRCPAPQPPMTFPCPDPKNKSDYYVAFKYVADRGFVFDISYYVEVGFRTGAVDYVFATVHTDSHFP